MMRKGRLHPDVQTIIRLAENMGIDVSLASIKDGSAMYDHGKNTIVVDRKFLKHASTQWILYALAHEIGHHLDLCSLQSKRLEAAGKANWALKEKSESGKPMSERHRTEILDREDSACEFGEALLGALGILIDPSECRRMRDQVAELYYRNMTS